MSRQNLLAGMAASVRGPGEDVSKIASRIGVSLDRVGFKIPETLTPQQPQEFLDTPLPVDNPQSHETLPKGMLR